ncbi:MAG: efflux RND transporter periplasmic adaptor subunit [Syntrophaceae bacterium]|nr:efflux RND transporter periplasmic adaptor subunit [Syntrophaceae bacterium]
MEAPNEKPARKPRKNVLLLLAGITFLVLGGYFGVQWLSFRLNYVSTDDAQVKGNLVNLSAKVSARIGRMLVEEGDHVKEGQILVELDPKDYLAARAQAQASLEMARQDLAKAIPQLALIRDRVLQGIDTAETSYREAREGLKFAEDDALLQADRVQKDIDRALASLKAARARVAEAKATTDNTQKEYERAQELFKNKYIAENARDAAETAWQVAQSKYQAALENEREALSQLELAEANRRSVALKEQSIRIAEQVLQRTKINLALAQEEKKQISIQEKNIEFLKAKVQEAEATLHLAELRLQDTKVVSPIWGVISKRYADQGQLVQPGQPLLVVNNPSEKWVVANVEETKVRRVHRGSKARVEADAFPGREFEGQVEFIGAAALSEFALLPAENPSGNFVKITHRLPVRISVKDPDHLLKPGMMVVVAIEAR